MAPLEHEVQINIPVRRLSKDAPNVVIDQLVFAMSWHFRLREAHEA